MNTEVGNLIYVISMGDEAQTDMQAKEEAEDHSGWDA